jgi:hypothetical protein
MVGILLCLGTAALLPRQAGAWMAATIVGGDPWTAGQTLMRDADAASGFGDQLRRLGLWGFRSVVPPNGYSEATSSIHRAPER